MRFGPGCFQQEIIPFPAGIVEPRCYPEKTDLRKKQGRIFLNLWSTFSIVCIYKSNVIQNNRCYIANTAKYFSKKLSFPNLNKEACNFDYIYPFLNRTLSPSTNAVLYQEAG